MSEKKEDYQLSNHKNKPSLLPYTERFTLNLTNIIKEKLDDFVVYGRDEEIRRVGIYLNRINKNAPVLVGDAGVGKTAIVEGFVASCLKKEVIPKFHDMVVHSLSLKDISGETINEKGEKESLIVKLSHIIEELRANKDNHILFIDEVHTIMGTGAADGETLDAANALKEVLARGDINLISATTMDEFRIIEKDPAMERRLQPIYINEPSQKSAIAIMMKIRNSYELKKSIKITDEAVHASVEFSVRYQADKQLPDKAIDLLDIALSEVEYAGKDTVDKIDIAKVISKNKNIPLDILMRVTDGTPRNIAHEIKKVIKGQDHAIDVICRKIIAGKIGMQNKNRPIATAILLGLTGTGKTELGKQISLQEFGTTDAMIRIDSSEFNDKGSILRLIGNAETGEAGYLTERVRRSPYSIILIDEIEKAHPDVHNLLLQVFDDGRLTDYRGRTIDFKNTIIICTSNVGHKTIKSKFNIIKGAILDGDFSRLDNKSNKAFMANIDRDLDTVFRPEFINRFQAKIVMNILVDKTIKEIIMSKFSLLEKKWKQEVNVKICFGTERGTSVHKDKHAREVFYEYIKNIGTDSKNGARPLERVISDKIIDEISNQIYFMGKRDGDQYEAHILLEGDAPLAELTKDGKRSIVDRRALNIKVKRINF
ncbi:TPA: AAA family ATPase [Streptococcus agalactiae]|nr:ATP-dependent Clp protease ATP-binding subunit [Streptococcus agalactiae]HEO4177421.1 ATP-dependent Clp protease ATP-binding subunit [Streptococcus agalactiae]